MSAGVFLSSCLRMGIKVSFAHTCTFVVMVCLCLGQDGLGKENHAGTHKVVVPVDAAHAEDVALGVGADDESCGGERGNGSDGLSVLEVLSVENSAHGGNANEDLVSALDAVRNVRHAAHNGAGGHGHGELEGETGVIHVKVGRPEAVGTKEAQADHGHTNASGVLAPELVGICEVGRGQAEAEGAESGGEGDSTKAESHVGAALLNSNVGGEPTASGVHSRGERNALGALELLGGAHIRGHVTGDRLSDATAGALVCREGGLVHVLGHPVFVLVLESCPIKVLLPEGVLDLLTISFLCCKLHSFLFFSIPSFSFFSLLFIQKYNMPTV